MRIRVAASIAVLAVLLYTGATVADGTPPDQVPDHILILKQQHKLILMAKNHVIKTYPVALGRRRGRKLNQGDMRTPEGDYVVDGRDPHSRYHLSLHLSYPNANDVRRAAAAGVDPGGGIEIHGLPRDIGLPDARKFYRDWTDGCIAVGNRAIEEIWALVPDGTPVEIRP